MVKIISKYCIFFYIAAILAVFYACSSDYKGADPENLSPVIYLYDTTDSTSSKKTTIKWYGNDTDGIKLKYFYTVTTDTFVNEATVFDKLPLDINNPDKWTSTYETYANISLPYYNYNADTCFMDIRDYGDVITDTGDTVSVTFKAVFSKFFVVGIDESDKMTPVKSKIFKRTNVRPKHPMVYSDKLGVNGFDKYWITVGTDSAQLIMPEPNEFWKEIDFKWMGEDPDGMDVELEFKWNLFELREPLKPDTLIALRDWSRENLAASFSGIIYNNNKNGRYSFRVWVRDDAFEQSEFNSTINFEVFAPTFDKGILFIDDTDPTLYPPPAYSQWMGNPEAAKVTEFYKNLLEYSGYKPEGDNSVDSLYWYKIARFERTVTESGRTYYSPNIRELIKYRLVILSSEDRSTYNGINFNGETGYAGYKTALQNYMDVGGNVFIIGTSVLQGERYNQIPSQLPVNMYKKPFRQIFEKDIYDNVTVSVSVPATNTDLRIFFSKYFGIEFMDFPEYKTYYTIPGTDSTQYCADHYMADNYDFVGAELYEHVPDIAVTTLRIDSTKVNEAWYNSPPGTGGRIRQHALKDRGTVFTGVPVLEAFKGEIVYSYKSIYDLPRLSYNQDYSFDYPWENEADTLKHSLILTNRVTGETVGPVFERSGSVAIRYIEENRLFRTAFFTMPLYFMDNSDGQVSEMFKAMIDWFDLESK